MSRILAYRSWNLVPQDLFDPRVAVVVPLVLTDASGRVVFYEGRASTEEDA